MALFDLLGQRWVLRILWELHSQALNFRELQSRCGGVSPTSLNNRLKELRELGLVAAGASGYELTPQGRSLGKHLLKLVDWSEEWAASLDLPRSDGAK